MPDASTAAARRKKPRHRSGLPLSREWRQVQKPLEIRSVSDGPGDTIVLEGSPIVYNTPYVVRDMFGEFEETMMPGVAATALAAGADVRFLFNHDGMPLGRTANGTLTFTDTPEALMMRVVMSARSQLANDLAVAIERGDVDQMSCGFVVGLDEWSSDWTQRSIYRFDNFFDVSAVTYPASPTTSIEMALRSMLAVPVASRSRIRVAWKAAQEARAGKVLSAENAELLQNALEALHEADDVDIPSIVKSLQTIDSALDAGQEGLSAVLDKANPDGDADDLEPELGNEEENSAEDGTEAPTSDGIAPGIADGTGSRSADTDPDAEVRAGFIPAPYHHDADEVVTCPNCGLGDADDARYCDQCGFQLIGSADVTLNLNSSAPMRSERAALELEAELLQLRGRRHRG